MSAAILSTPGLRPSRGASHGPRGDCVDSGLSSTRCSRTSSSRLANGDRPKAHPPDLTLYGTKRRDFGASPGESGWNGASRGMQSVKLPPPRIGAFWDDPQTGLAEASEVPLSSSIRAELTTIGPAGSSRVPASY